MTVFNSPRFHAREIEDPKKLSRLLENAFGDVQNTSIDNSIQREAIQDQVTIIEDQVTDIENGMGEGADPDAIVTNIDLTAVSGTDTAIYTLPTGNAFIKDLYLVGRDVTGTGDDPLVSLGIDSDTDVALPQLVRNFSVSPITRNVFRFPLYWSLIRLTEQATISLYVGTASTRTTFTVDAYLYLGKTDG